MSSLDTTPGNKAVPRLDVPVPIFYWVEMIISRLQGWTSESVAVWRELTGYRLENAYHCKFTNTQNEHEFIIYEFCNEQNMKLELRADRSVGERKGALGTGSDSDFSSIDSSDTQSEGSSHSAASPYFSNHRSSRSTSSIASMKEGLSKVSGSFKRLARRLSDSTMSRPSAFSSDQFLADDRIVRIQGHPKKSEVLRTMTFKGDRARWPSLWDIMILVQVVHDDSTMYKLLGRQCYWFADSMFGLLERWSTEHKNGTVCADSQRKSKWGKRAQASTGSLGIVPVHRRDDDQMRNLWNSYLKERKSMDAQREGFERKQTQMADRERQLQEQLKKEQEEKERQLRELRKEQEKRERRLKEEQEERERRLKEEQDERERRVKEEQEERERQLRDQLRKEQEKRERRLKEEQEERERRVKEEQEERERQLRDQLRKEQRQMKDEQDEKDRRLARELQVRERRMREEQELNERQLTGQFRREQEENERRLREQFQKELQDTHLEWQARLMQAMEENDRRFREITQMLNLNDANLNESTSTPAQILHPQSGS
ncbi:hypothetical protein APHAL10511_000663 [Amanita phalloides]|nr:hypothetical protein APHAL10511_000663 [Amanita phalloides]